VDRGRLSVHPRVDEEGFLRVWALWTAEHDGVTITASDLRDLLDRLEERA